jgi:phosphoesterase RecJ-like protein
MNDKALKEVAGLLRSKDNFLITAHVNPEGDSIGSQLSMFRILEKMGKKAVMVGNYNVPNNLKFLPGTKSILHEVPEDFHPDVVIILDCPTKERIGKVAEYLNDSQLIMNIDHHVSNEPFGDINWVESGSSSVGEMMYGIIKELDIELDRSIGMALYTAIVTDTGMFNYDNTSKRTHEIAAELIAGGINPKDMHGEIFENKSISQIRLLGKVLTTVKVEEEGRLAYMCITRQMYEAEGVKSVATDEFINYPRSIKGVDVAVFFKERVYEPDMIDISFRSSKKIDVDEIASRFGGGGHKRASGCLVKGGLEEVKEKVLGEIRKALKA